MEASMSKGLKFVLIILGIFILFIFFVGEKLIAGYNQVITMDENVKNKWVQAENVRSRRV
jgi:hypothetical protein